MAAAIVVLLIIDTTITGYLVSHVKGLTRTVAMLGDIQQEHDHVIDGLVRGNDAR